MVKGVDGKLDAFALLKQQFEPIIGQTFSRIETAQLEMEDGSWGDWFDLPARLFFGSDCTISISWSYFDKLFISKDLSLPFDIADAKVRWNAEAAQCLSPLVGLDLKGVELGRGELTIGDTEIEIWTRILFNFGSGWMEIYNDLDSTGFAFYEARPKGTFEMVC